MRINDPDAYRIATDIDVIAELLDLAGSRILELGCGAAGSTRQLVERLHPAEVVDTELDIDAVRLQRIRAAFDRHLTPSGAHFLKPHRIDLLRKGGVAM